MKNPTVNLLVACTNRKRIRPRADLRLRSVRRAPRSRASCWIERVDAACPEAAVEDLYAGDSWYIARRLDAGLDSAQLWALSAGYGLVRSDDRIASYEATLSSGHSDSVHRSGDRVGPKSMRRRWWSELCGWQGPAPSGSAPRSIAELASAASSAAIVVSAGADYIEATMSDLVAAAAALESPERLVVLGSGQCPERALDESWVSLPAKLRTVVGGSLGSLSIRAAERVLQDAGTSVTAARGRAVVAELCKNVADLTPEARRPLDDDEVAEWIADRLASEPSLTKTVALRGLRADGYACEQSRFGRLFAEVQDALT